MNTKKILLTSTDLFYISTDLINEDVQHLYFSPKHSKSLRGNIYKGVIQRIEPSLSAVFVDIGTDKNGFLSLTDIEQSYFSNNERNINNLTIGQEIVVQIQKDKVKNKGVSLTTKIAIIGRTLILSLKKGGVIFSKSLLAEDKKRLSEWVKHLIAPEDCSVILRTGANMAERCSDLQAELDALVKFKQYVLEKAESTSGVALIYEAWTFIQTILKEWKITKNHTIVTDKKALFQEATRTASIFYPSIVKNIHHVKANPSFVEQYKIIDKIKELSDKNVQLQCGGSIVIERTETLTTIDVNSSRYRRSGNIEDTSYRINMEACSVIAQQIRNREIHGIIAIDFIDTDPSLWSSIEKELIKSLSQDKARIKMLSMNSLGIVHLSRQQMGVCVQDVLTTSCNNCGGTGRILSNEIVAENILSDVRRTLAHKNDKTVIIFTSSNIHFTLSNMCKVGIRQIEDQYECEIYIYPYNMSAHQYDIKTYQHRIGSLNLTPNAGLKVFQPSAIDNISSIARQFLVDALSQSKVGLEGEYKSRSRIKVERDKTSSISVKEESKTTSKSPYERDIKNDLLI